MKDGDGNDPNRLGDFDNIEFPDGLSVDEDGLTTLLIGCVTP